jgi:type I restriction enzyme M protein
LLCYVTNLTLVGDNEISGSNVTNGFGEKVGFIWSIAELLRGQYKPAQYGRVILPLTVLRRLDCVLQPTKEKVLTRHAALQSGKVANIEPLLNRVVGASFHNASKLDVKKLTGESDKIAGNLTAYIKGFSSQVRDIFDKFAFDSLGTYLIFRPARDRFNSQSLRALRGQSTN